MDDTKKRILAGLDHSTTLLSQARNGDRDAAKQLYKYIATCIASGDALPGEIANWLSRSLTAIANGENADEVLYLRKRPGRPPTHSDEMQRFVAECIHYSTEGRHKAINSNDESTGAYSKVGAFFGISENTAEKYYKAYIDFIIAEEEINRELRREDE